MRYDFRKSGNLWTLAYVQPALSGAGRLLTVVWGVLGVCLGVGGAIIWVTAHHGDIESVSTGVGLLAVGILLAIGAIRRMRDHLKGFRREIRLVFDLDRRVLSVFREANGKTDRRDVGFDEIQRLDVIDRINDTPADESDMGLQLGDGKFRTLGEVTGGNRLEFLAAMAEIRATTGIVGDNDGDRRTSLLQPTIDGMFPA